MGKQGRASAGDCQMAVGHCCAAAGLRNLGRGLLAAQDQPDAAAMAEAYLLPVSGVEPGGH